MILDPPAFPGDSPMHRGDLHVADVQPMGAEHTVGAVDVLLLHVIDQPTDRFAIHQREVRSTHVGNVILGKRVVVEPRLDLQAVDPEGVVDMDVA